MQHPIVFTKAPQSVIGPGAAIKYPYGWSELVDYEAELAVIIGKPGRGIQKEDALDHIFGYTILNDVTAREVQKRHQQWFLGKSCDTFCPMGPWIVPASEIDGQDLAIQCWVNDELRQVWYPHTPEQTNCTVKSSFVPFLIWGICEDLTHPSSSQVDNFAYCQRITWMLCFNCFLGEAANLQKLPAQGPIDILNEHIQIWFC
jgi:hypothetical protein